MPMTCPSCGKPTIEGARFCGFCGSPITPPQASEANDSFDSTVLSTEPHQQTHAEAQSALATGNIPPVPLPNMQEPSQAQAPAQPTQQYQYAPAAQAPQATPQYQYPAVPMPDQASQPTQPTQEVPTPAQPDPSTNPQAQQTQQYQYAPAAQALQATPMPITQQTASAGAPQLAADPTITALTTPASVKTMGVSLGIGLAASLVFALLGSIIFLLLGHDIDSELSNIPNLSNSVDLFTSFGGSYSTPNFFQVLATVLVLGVSGSLNVTTSADGFSLGDLSNGADAHLYLPIGLPGVALAIGAAFGAYMLARKSALRFKWTGAISSAIVGVLSGLVVVILAAIFPAKIGGSYAYYSASASLSGASFRTFFMAFLLAGLGALAGYALAQFAPDSNNVFSATWRWAHRTRGFVRTLVESAAIYGVLFLALGLVALIVATAASGSALAGILLIPLLLPAVPFVLFSVSSFGGVTASVSGQSSYTLSLFNVASVTQYAWALWICFVLFIIATIYIALRETARNMYDPYYAKWENTWKAPVAVMVFWLVAEFLCTNFLAGYSSNTVSTMVPMWYFIVAGVWAFLVEVIAMTFGPTLVASTPGLWKILVGGTVQQTPQNVVDYAKACDPHFGQPKAARTAASAQTTQTAQYNAQYNAQYANPSAPATSPAAQTAPTQAMPAVPMPTTPMPTTPIPAPAASVPPVPQPTASVPPMPQSPADIPMPAVPQGEGKPLDPKTKKTILIGCIVAGALIVLGIIYGVLNSTVFSAKSMAESYVSAIASGDYDKANDIADPQVGKNQRKLLSNSVAKTDNATISNAHVNGVKSGNGTTTASISYSLNGETVDEELTMRKSGNKFLIFPNWQITTPLIKSINVSVPSSVESLTVNKVAVTAKNAEKTDSGEWQLRVYPGTYNISVTSTDYIVSETVVFRTNEDSDSPTTLKVTTTSKFKDALSTAVNNALDKCAESTDYAPENCPFGFRVWDEDNYRNFAWSISIYPKIDEVDLDYGAFDTKTGKAKCTYEVKDGDSWDPDDDSTTFNASGSFAIKDGKVTVTLDDGGYSY